MPPRNPATRPATYVLLIWILFLWMISVLIEIALLERHDMRLVPKFVAEVQGNHGWNDEVVGHEIEPGEFSGLENADVGAEQYDDEQHQREPRAVGVELGLELQIIQAAALREPRFAEPQMAHRDTQPNEKAAQARSIIEQLIDLLVAHHGGEEGHRTHRPCSEQRQHRVGECDGLLLHRG